MTMFGAGAACEGALRLETMGRHNDLARAAEVWAAVERDIELVKQDLSALLCEAG
jgi:hypothetical protein